MNQFLNQLKRRWGVDPVILGIYAASLLLYATAWWLRQSTVRFNINVFEIAGGVLVMNLALTSLAVRKEVIIGYLLAGSALFVQLLLLILLWKASQGALS